MKYDPLYNFISPITGRILCRTDYVLVGNGKGVAIPSPVLINVRLDIIELRLGLNRLDKSLGIITTNYNLLSSADFVIGHPNSQLPDAQVLSLLPDGCMFNTGGVVSTSSTLPVGTLPDLTENHLWQGNSSDRPVEVIALKEVNLPNLEWLKLWLGDIHSRPQAVDTIDLRNLPPLTTISVPGLDLLTGEIYRGTGSGVPEASNALSLAEADILAINVRLAGSAFVLNNGNPILETLMPFSQFLSNLGGGMAKILVGGLFAIAIPNEDYVTPSLLEEEISTLEEEISAIEEEVATMQGEIATIEGEIATLQGQVLVLEGAVALLQTEVAALQGEIATLQTQIGVLQAQIVVLQGQIVVLQGEIIALGVRIDDLRLNNIPASGDVDFSGFKLLQVGTPVNGTDGVNKDYVDTKISDGIENLDVVLQGFVEGGPAVDGIIETTRGPDCLLTNIPAGGDVDMDNNRITNLKQSPEEDFDAISFTFLWDILHDEVDIIWL